VDESDRGGADSHGPGWRVGATWNYAVLGFEHQDH
jgi:hypothetical protein